MDSMQSKNPFVSQIRINYFENMTKSYEKSGNIKDLWVIGAPKGTRLRFLSLVARENKGPPPSSRRRQQPTGLAGDL